MIFIGVTAGVKYLALVKIRFLVSKANLGIQKSLLITQILKNNEIGLENKMVLDILCFICLMVLLPFAAMYSSLPFFPFTARRTRHFLLNEN